MEDTSTSEVILTNPKEIDIVGAGLSGLAAAIILARNDWKVEVFEKHATIGQRFHGDFQGLENWTQTEDVLDSFDRWGIDLDFWLKPFYWTFDKFLAI